MDAWSSTALHIAECPGSEEDDHVHIFVADVVTYFDIFRLRFIHAAGCGGAGTGDGGIPQGCPPSMVFTVALLLPWCKCLEAIGGIKPQLYADNLKCVSGKSDALLGTARISNQQGKLLLPPKVFFSVHVLPSDISRRAG